MFAVILRYNFSPQSKKLVKLTISTLMNFKDKFFGTEWTHENWQDFENLVPRFWFSEKFIHCRQHVIWSTGFSIDYSSNTYIYGPWYFTPLSARCSFGKKWKSPKPLWAIYFRIKSFQARMMTLEARLLLSI